MKSFLPVNAFRPLLCCLLLASPCKAGWAQSTLNLTQYVNTFVGTQGLGSTFPGALSPTGMIAWSPDTNNIPGNYAYTSTSIKGFSLTHFSGRGVNYLGDLPFMPYLGRLDLSPATDPASYTAMFSHANETAQPGYYSVLLDNGVQVELTTTMRTGSGRFTFPSSTNSTLLLNTGGSTNGDTGNTGVTITSPTEITGYATTTDGSDGPKHQTYTVYFAAEFDRPFAAQGTWNGNTVTYGSTGSAGPQSGAFVTFDTTGNNVVNVRTSISYVSIANAQYNLAVENPTFDFPGIQSAANDAWNATLNKVQASGGTLAELQTFYTMLYLSFIHPNIVDDANGQYLGMDDTVHQLPSGHHQYQNISGWDMYRSLVPLRALLAPQETSDLMQSLVNWASEGGGGALPRWEQVNRNSNGMEGEGQSIILASGYAFGATGFDTASAETYMENDLSVEGASCDGQQPESDISTYLSLGYLPGSASQTLELSEADFALAQFAGQIGDSATAAKYLTQSGNWFNTFNLASGFPEPRNADGSWEAGFDPLSETGFREGDAYQYTWLVPYDVADLAVAMGGNGNAIARLNSFFTEFNASQTSPYFEIGDEPGEEVPWEYDFLGDPASTQSLVRNIQQQAFAPTPEGLPGNNDGGAISSWYVFSAMGFYPEIPGVGGVVLGSPLFPSIVINLENGNQIAIDATNASAANPYVQSLTLNGANWSSLWVPFSLLNAGATLDFALGDAPSTWASTSSAAPPSYSPNPIFGSAVDYQSGFTPTGLKLNGSATLNGAQLQLTPDLAYQTGSAYYTAPVSVQSFANDFTFQLPLPVSNGITFVLQNQKLTALGSDGGNLGYGSTATGGGIQHSVAIKFDVHNNAGEGPDSTGLFTNGASPTVPSTDLTATGVNLQSGNVFHAYMTYNGTTLTVTLTDTVTGATATQNYTVDIPAIVGSNLAYAGFTAGTGASAAPQNILTWNFSPLPSPTTVVPGISPIAGTYAGPTTVKITDATAGAVIYYTADGSTPTTSSTVYRGPITVSTTSTIQAVALVPGGALSGVTGAAYTIQPPAGTAVPEISPAAGSYATPTTVTITDATAGAVIYYTTDGSIPTASSALYSGPIAVDATGTIQAVALARSYSVSAVASAAYTIESPLVSYPSGFTAQGLQLNGGATVTATALQLTDGGLNEARSAYFNSAMNIQAFTSDFDFQLLNAIASGFTFVIQNQGLSAVGSPGAGLGYGVEPDGTGASIANSVAVKFDIDNDAGEGTDSVGLYVNGASPTLPATDLTSTGLQLDSGDEIHAHIVYDGTNLTLTLTDAALSTASTTVFPVDIPATVGGGTAYVGFTGATNATIATTQNILDWTYTVTLPPTAVPGISPLAGTYAAPAVVTITDATAGAILYYTTDGTTPTAASTVYSGPITLNASATIQAVAQAPGDALSAVAGAGFTIATALPVISPATGSYPAPAIVTIADATAGATIYYTTNGGTPTTASMVYSGPITVSASETIQAIALAPGDALSGVVTAQVNITSPPGAVVPNTQSLNFGTVAKGQTATLPLTFTNQGLPGVVTVAYTTGSTSFKVTSNGCATGIANGNACTIEIEFAPVSSGSKTANIRFIPSSGPSDNVTLEGTLTP